MDTTKDNIVDWKREFFETHQSRFCPNCVPDYLNRVINYPPLLRVYYLGGTEYIIRECSVSCGMGYNPCDAERVWQTWLRLVINHEYPDHYSDAIAVYTADRGLEGIKKFVQLAKSWQEKGDEYLYDKAHHAIALSWMALYCEWPVSVEEMIQTTEKITRWPTGTKPGSG